MQTLARVECQYFNNQFFSVPVFFKSNFKREKKAQMLLFSLFIKIR